ncbi:hypothetical protein [Lysobacter gummosus]|uniref:hypothetical protein n=1 Tax=Lysobacter gummosus TaxID=262324 RepID=UPI003626A842
MRWAAFVRRPASQPRPADRITHKEDSQHRWKPGPAALNASKPNSRSRTSTPG